MSDRNTCPYTSNEETEEDQPNNVDNNENLETQRPVNVSVTSNEVDSSNVATVSHSTAEETDTDRQHQLWREQGARPRCSTSTHEPEMQRSVNIVASNEENDIDVSAVSNSTAEERDTDRQHQLWREQGARPKTTTSFTKKTFVEEERDEEMVEHWRDIPLPSSLDSNEILDLEEGFQTLESCSLASPATSRSVCKHGYNHRCSLLFPCCGVLYHCHQCHNEAETGCGHVRSREATHLTCSQCNQKQKVHNGYKILVDRPDRL